MRNLRTALPGGALVRSRYVSRAPHQHSVRSLCRLIPITLSTRPPPHPPRPRAIARHSRPRRPDLCHVASEGPIGFYDAFCRKRGPFTTIYHTRFPELFCRSAVPRVVHSCTAIPQLRGRYFVARRRSRPTLRPRFLRLMPGRAGGYRIVTPRNVMQFARPGLPLVGRIGSKKTSAPFSISTFPSQALWRGPQR